MVMEQEDGVQMLEPHGGLRDDSQVTASVQAKVTCLNNFTPLVSA